MTLAMKYVRRDKLTNKVAGYVFGLFYDITFWLGYLDKFSIIRISSPMPHFYSPILKRKTTLWGIKIGHWTNMYEYRNKYCNNKCK